MIACNRKGGILITLRKPITETSLGISRGSDAFRRDNQHSAKRVLNVATPSVRSKSHLAGKVSLFGEKKSPAKGLHLLRNWRAILETARRPVRSRRRNRRTLSSHESRSGSKLNSQTGGCGDRPATGTGTDGRTPLSLLRCSLLDARAAYFSLRSAKENEQDRENGRENGRNVSPHLENNTDYVSLIHVARVHRSIVVETRQPFHKGIFRI